MSRQEVVMIKCDRCKREELRPANTAKKDGTEFQCQFQGKTLSYEDLCSRCRTTIILLMERVKEWERDLKSLLMVNGHEEGVPPVTPAPNYKPPQAHSDASQKR